MFSHEGSGGGGARAWEGLQRIWGGGLNIFFFGGAEMPAEIFFFFLHGIRNDTKSLLSKTDSKVPSRPKLLQKTSLQK